MLGKSGSINFVAGLILFFLLSYEGLAHAVNETISNLSLTAASADNLPTDDLICSYDLSGNSIAAAVSWTRNGSNLLRLYLPFEGGEAKALLDYSGNGLLVTKGADAAWRASEGHDGNGAFEFNGGGNAELDIENAMPPGAYTKMAWVKRMGDGTNNIISGNSGHALFAPGPNFRLSAGHNGRWPIGNNKSWDYVEDTESLQQGRWYHVAVSYDPDVEGGRMILYKNGVEADRASNVPVQDPSDKKIYIGAFDGANNWNGMIDDVMIFERALSPAQIASIYSNGPKIIVSDETDRGEVWRAYVTPFSSDGTGATHETDPLTIADAYTITATVDGNGRILPSGAVSVNSGKDKTFTIVIRNKSKI